MIGVARPLSSRIIHSKIDPLKMQKDGKNNVAHKYV
jgi:hypothetical protein